ncbi:glycosylinositol phosphorylceramide mannosyl transferase 1 isoform X2 [Magnolia sinica]|uniref:glycosylinositol phosphorylceramide mannosyl transferase 1 isoform X2 n=1 Tax=Magnolia sinica TaxID=86752 RepID=UPI00265844CD|nr:glycosylinositol phosphorylceramide mannosyl transferase 1 isoform X2 [Magnolia sinica]
MRGSPSSRRLLQRFRQLTISAIGSVKIKLLLACCIAFTLVVITGRAAAFMGWRHHVTVGSSPPRKGYTILINTWKRNDLLKKSISHYTSCPGVDAIRIVWSEPNPPSDSLRGFLWKTLKSNSKDGKEIELRFDINKEDSLNNRFKEIKDLKTDAVFSIDDDVVFPCSSVEFAFSVWQSAPATMVGFVPRMHWVDKTSNHPVRGPLIISLCTQHCRSTFSQGQLLVQRVPQCTFPGDTLIGRSAPFISGCGMPLLSNCQPQPKVAPVVCA